MFIHTKKIQLYGQERTEGNIYRTHGDMTRSLSLTCLDMNHSFAKIRNQQEHVYTFENMDQEKTDTCLYRTHGD